MYFGQDDFYENKYYDENGEISYVLKLMEYQIRIQNWHLKIAAQCFISDYDSECFVAEDEEYDLPDDIYDTKGLFDNGQEGKQDNEELLYAD